MTDSDRAIKMIPVVVVTLLLSLTTPNFSDIPSFEVKKPLDQSNEIFKIQRIEQEYLKIEKNKKPIYFFDEFGEFAVYRMTFLGKDLIYSNYHFWVFYCYLGMGLFSIVLLSYIAEDWGWKISQFLEEKKLFKKQEKMNNLLEGVTNNPEQMELVIKTMEEDFNYKLNSEQKDLVVKSIQKVAGNNRQITMLDCFQEWNKYYVLDNWNAYVEKYFFVLD